MKNYNLVEEDGFHSYKQSFYDMTYGHGVNYIHQMCFATNGSKHPRIHRQLIFLKINTFISNVYETSYRVSNASMIFTFSR